MQLIATLGVLAIVLQQVRSLPQVVRILRLRDTTGVSTLTWCLQLTVNVTWFAYGFVADDSVFVVNNIFTIIGAVAVLLAIAQHGDARYSVPFLTVGLSAALVLGILQLAGDTAFYVFAVGLGVVMFIPQVIKVFRTSAVAVSPMTWTLTAVSSAVWLSYGLAAQRLAITICHLVILPCCIAILARLRMIRTTAPQPA